MNTKQKRLAIADHKILSARLQYEKAMREGKHATANKWTKELVHWNLIREKIEEE